MGREANLYGDARNISDELRRIKKHPDILVGLYRSPTKMTFSIKNR